MNDFKIGDRVESLFTFQDLRERDTFIIRDIQTNDYGIFISPTEGDVSKSWYHISNFKPKE
jgi:hypothetical protein